MNDEQDFESDNEEVDNATSALEAEFRALVDDVNPKIDALLSEARVALDKAVKLSEKYGVPFSGGISFLDNGYVPASFFDSKFQKLDIDVVSDITEVYGAYAFEYSGWVHSAVC
jgi:hypothetical protein